MVFERLMPIFEQHNTRIINSHLDNYPKNESELDRLEMKLVPLLQKTSAIGSSSEQQIIFVLNIARDHLSDNESVGRQR